MALALAAWRRPDTRRRLLRIGAGLAAVGGLWLVAFPPTRTQQQPASQTAIVLTDGYSPDGLRQLLRRVAAGTPVWRYGTTPPDTQTLTNLPALRQRLPQLRTVHVLGRGLPAADVPTLHGLQVVAHPAAQPVGFRAAAWSRQPELGQPWAVEGYCSATDPIWVSLQAAGALRDSVRLPAGGGAFRLRFTPKAEGRAVYSLVARREGKVLAQEPLPLEVRPTRPLRVLVLAAAPSFEVRFLKNYLASHQHSVAVRTGVSRGVVQTEFLNSATSPDLSRLTPALLARTELVLADAGSLAALSGAESAALAQAVRAGTCGVLLLADAATIPHGLPGAGAFRLVARPAAATAPQPLSWPDAPTRPAALLPATLRPGPEFRLLVTAPHQQPVAGVRRLGLGQVAVTTVTETFPWLLQGQAAAYEAYWSHLLTALVPATSSVPAIQLTTAWPHPDAPVTVQVTGASAPYLRLQAGRTTPVQVALRQDAYVPEWSTAPYWPTAPGWHEAQAGAVRHWFYVFSNEQWRGPAQQEWLRAVASLGPATTVSAAPATFTTHSAWPRWWGYLLFLLGAGLLWLEEKL
ncbi:hypothetical protein HNQ93_003040 [Hymenobacter luteus]|uniref:Uncharacterized protein n=2 Tax=Hymenobacter TaxID=89966 RepID=A0A7W9WBT7_9BACT|nr:MULTISPECIES: hypothetical protein [Hymenobacter]MBB4603276.1 hypothetical protein [Hymenobacter latericoloratus]MBB6060174.1 hypothetical protein [Hymenobacter luteus]